MLEGQEVFDSNLLKQMIESIIASGKRNVTVDLSQLDYLYSDAINALIVMNKRMLDVMGRLSLLAPQAPVLEILKKAGIQNILKIFADEAELVRTSQELTGQASAPSVQITTPPPQEPQSEFDELRSEIGSALEPKFAPPQPRTESAPVAPSYNEAGFPSMQQPMQPGMAQRGPYMPPSQPQFAPPPPPAGPAPRYAPPPPPLRPFDQTSQRPPARPFTPAPPPLPPKPAGFPPASIGPSGAETRRMPVVQPEVSIPVRPLGQAEDELDKIEATLEMKAPAAEKPSAGRFDEFDETPKKRSFVPVLVILLLVIVLGGGGYYAYITYFQGKVPMGDAVKPPEKKETSMPQLPTENPPAATAPTTEPAAASATTPTPATTPAPAVAAAKPAPAPEPVAPKPVVVPPRKKPEPAVAHPKVVAKPARTPKAVANTPAPVPDLPPVEPPSTPAPSSSAIDLTEPPAPTPEPPKPVASTPAPAPRASLPPAAAPIAPPAPTLEPEPAASSGGGGEPATMFIASIPPLADIYVDGKLVGKTNLGEVKVTSGTHTLRFVKGDKETTKQLTIQPGKNPSQMVRIQ